MKFLAPSIPIGVSQAAPMWDHDRLGRRPAGNEEVLSFIVELISNEVN